MQIGAQGIDSGLASGTGPAVTGPAHHIDGLGVAIAVWVGEPGHGQGRQRLGLYATPLDLLGACRRRKAGQRLVGTSVRSYGNAGRDKRANVLGAHRQVRGIRARAAKDPAQLRHSHRAVPRRAAL